MTRFDEALQQYALAAEPEMRTKVASPGNRYTTIQDVGRGRSRRAALQATASLAIVALLGGGVWVASHRTNTVDPAAPRTVDAIRVLGADPFVCGAPFPYEKGIVVTAAVGDVPDVKQYVGHLDGRGFVGPDLGPGATTLAREDGVTVDATGGWVKGQTPPQFWGFESFGALVDSKGDVVARTELNAPETTSGSNANGIFWPYSCGDPDAVANGNYPEPLNGTYTVHVVTQLWVENPGTVAAQWVDEGLPANASLSFDYSLYEAEQAAAAERADKLATEAKHAIDLGGENLATVNGAAILPSTSACEVASVIEEGGLASQPAMSAGFSGVRAEFDGRVVISEYTFDIGPQWWAQGGDFAVFFFDAQGELASVGVTDGYDQLEGPDGITSRAVLKPYESCGLTGVPTASGTYKAFVFVPYPDTGAVAPPSGLQDLDALNYVSGWAPLGTYTVN